MAMRYTEKDIPNIPLTEFMAALGEKPVKAFEDMKLYYAPQRNDPEPMLVVDTDTNRWYDHATDESGDIIDLAALKMNPNLYMDPRDFILKYMNEYEEGKELSAMSRRPAEPTITSLDIKNLPLEEFMRAMGYAPVAQDGNILIYESPYSADGRIEIDTAKNVWKDGKEPEKYNGGIYDLAYEITGSCNRSELNLFIAAEMKKIIGSKCYEATANGKSADVRPEHQKTEIPKPKPGRKMRF
ncbi:hypothetical protein IMSAGC008_01287 [Muribaculaceae bacterium]|nr:hypothetical protein IMSAGC008_01287 [Muribaculaceae bacterium]